MNSMLISLLRLTFSKSDFISIIVVLLGEFFGILPTIIQEWYLQIKTGSALMLIKDILNLIW